MDSLLRWTDVPVTKHLTQRRLLIRPNDGHRFQIDFQVGIDGIRAEIVFLEHGKTDDLALPFDPLSARKMLSADSNAGDNGAARTSILVPSISND